MVGFTFQREQRYGDRMVARQPYPDSRNQSSGCYPARNGDLRKISMKVDSHHCRPACRLPPEQGRWDQMAD